MAVVAKLQNVRLSFPDLFSPRKVNDEGNPRFGASLLFAPGSENHKKLETAIREAANEKWGGKAEAVLKQLSGQDRVCLRDGSTKAYDGYDGNMYVSASSTVKPGIFGRDRRELREEDGVIYAGCFVNASIEVWAQDNKYGKRINATLRGVQFFADGNAFSGGRPANADEFDDLSEGAAADFESLV